MHRCFPFAFAAGLTLLFAGSSCSRHHTLTRVEEGDRDGILHLGNAAEPRELDPQLAVGIPESIILYAIGEGVVTADQHDLHPTPGVAESWDVSPDQLTWTFHLRADAQWSNGAPLTASDFVGSYERELNPKMAAELASFLFPIKNAEAYNKRQILDFNEVGVHAPDAHTLRLDLAHPTPYLLRSMLQRMWFPVYLPGIQKTGAVDDRSNQNWTRPGNYVGNGPYVLTEWQTNQQIVVKKNPHYWNSLHLRINEVHFYPYDDGSSEEQAYRAGLLHKTYNGNIPVSRFESYQREHPEVTHTDPYLGVYYYMLNTTRPPLNDPRLRRALAMSVDRASLVKNVTRLGQQPAGNYTPPHSGDYTSRTQIPYDPAAARKLLADAGHPGGAGLPPIEIMLNKNELHAQIAEAIQQMWQRELGVTVTISAQEWKVYLNSRRTMDYTILRAGWRSARSTRAFSWRTFFPAARTTTRVSPDPEYDRLLHAAQNETDPARRDDDFQKAEAVLLDAAPIVPVYFYTNPYLLRTSVRGWVGNVIDYHPFADLYLQP